MRCATIYYYYYALLLLCTLSGRSRVAAATVAGAAGRARISERAYNHPMRTARGHHRAASGVAGRPWARDLCFRDDLGVTDNGTYPLVTLYTNL